MNEYGCGMCEEWYEEELTKIAGLGKRVNIILGRLHSGDVGNRLSFKRSVHLKLTLWFLVDAVKTNNKNKTKKTKPKKKKKCNLPVPSSSECNSFFPYFQLVQLPVTLFLP